MTLNYQQVSTIIGSLILLCLVFNFTSQEIPNKRVANAPKEIIIPSGYEPVKLNTIRTSYVGTVDHPTMDGGLINVNDGMPVAQDQPNIKIRVLDKPKEIPVLKTNNSFEDSWAKSQKVKSVLNKAVQDGKLDFVMNESTKRGLPASVAIIPIVESKYSDNAVSPKGAAGDWQIMPSLASDYQLSNNERFDFKKSTQVALDHIKQLYRQFGNWELVFAAYNAGSGRVLNAIHKNPNAKSIDELSLPLETKMYVSKIKSINNLLLMN